jgi:hypothetical protein
VVLLVDPLLVDPLQQHNNYPGSHILGMLHYMLVVAGHRLGSGTHCHILPVVHLRPVLDILGLHILGLLPVQLPSDHSIVETDVLWKNDTPLQVC